MAQQLVYLAVVIGCLSSAYLANGGSLFNLTGLTEDSHDVYQCPDPTNLTATPLCRLNIEQSGQLFQVITKTVKCPETGINKVKLACIMVTDLDANDHGGYSSIQSGGLEQYYVDIYLKSQRSRGLNFLIEVYTENSTSLTE